MAANNATVILSRIFTKKDGEDWSGVYVPKSPDITPDPRDSSIFNNDEIVHIGSQSDARLFKGFNKVTRDYPSDNVCVINSYFDDPANARAYFKACAYLSNTAPIYSIINDKKEEKTIPDYQVYWVLRNIRTHKEYPLGDKE
jgi:hypothetical protein